VSDRLDQALARARDTKELVLRASALNAVEQVFARHFGGRPALVVTDLNTRAVAGDRVAGAIPRSRTFVLHDPDLYAEWKYVEQLDAALRAAPPDAVPVSVGSGTINDLTKLAAHRAGGRQYLCVATAASMDGYTAYGASITKDGSKQTFECPAPRAVVADVDVIASAPSELTASGYADLLAKVTAGADWILADALGIEPIDRFAWDTVHLGLRDAVGDPAGCRRGDPAAITRLTKGLMMGGFAMQASQSSRVASGAEHQFSHLWDMQRHGGGGAGGIEAGGASHGFQVGIGTLAAARLYGELLSRDLDRLDLDDVVDKYIGDTEETLRDLFPDNEELLTKAVDETRAKRIGRAELREQLVHLQSIWPDLRERLRRHLIPSSELAAMLAAAGAPTDSRDIGIPTERLRRSHRQAYHIRRRFTVLDLAVRTGLLDDALDRLYPARHQQAKP
jgi:glycerol-1-phosphate dehydrogenase [NAD(P)+]